MSKILGISSYYHDSAAALLVDGQIIAAVQEESLLELSTIVDSLSNQSNIAWILMIII